MKRIHPSISSLYRRSLLLINNFRILPQNQKNVSL